MIVVRAAATTRLVTLRRTITDSTGRRRHAVAVVKVRA